jgi:hypothetical protein
MLYLWRPLALGISFPRRSRLVTLSITHGWNDSTTCAAWYILTRCFLGQLFRFWILVSCCSWQWIYVFYVTKERIFCNIGPFWISRHTTCFDPHHVVETLNITAYSSSLKKKYILLSLAFLRRFCQICLELDHLVFTSLDFATVTFLLV